MLLIYVTYYVYVIQGVCNYNIIRREHYWYTRYRKHLSVITLYAALNKPHQTKKKYKILCVTYSPYYNLDPVLSIQIVHSYIGMCLGCTTTPRYIRMLWKGNYALSQLRNVYTFRMFYCLQFTQQQCLYRKGVHHMHKMTSYTHTIFREVFPFYVFMFKHTYSLH